MRVGDLCRMTNEFEVGDEDGLPLYSGPFFDMTEEGIIGYFSPNDVGIVISYRDMELHEIEWTSCKVYTPRGVVGWVDSRFLMEPE